MVRLSPPRGRIELTLVGDMPAGDTEGICSIGIERPGKDEAIELYSNSTIHEVGGRSDD